MQIAVEEKCCVCEDIRSFPLPDGFTTFELAMCEKCHTPLRTNDLLCALLEVFNAAQKEDLLVALRDKKILNVAFTGAIHDYLCELDGYTRSEYVADIENGSEMVEDVYCVDLCNIPFPDDYFDLIITEHVMEHVPDAQKAFSEIARTLTPNGRHIFSIPLSECLEKTRNREGLRRIYHDSLTNNCGAMVHYEYGRDILTYSETETSYTIPLKRKIFYEDHDVTDLERDYSDFMLNPENIFRIYKYNPAVFMQIKASGKCTNKDLKMGCKKIEPLLYGVHGGEKYQSPLFLGDAHARTTAMLKYLRPGSTVLEFGPNTGTLTRYLVKEKQCIVHIVERDERVYKEARKVASDGYCGDIEEYKWVEHFNNIQYDAIFFADVLEHLQDPGKALRQCLPLLKDDGIINCSIPNVAHAVIIANLMNNTFEYGDVGLLDRTHLRFFAHENLIPFFEEQGLSIIYETSVNIKFDETYEYKNNPYLKEIYPILMKRNNNTAYQYILVLQKSNYVYCNAIEHICDNVPDRYSFGCYFIDCGEGFYETSRKNVDIDGSCVTETGIHLSLTAELPKDAIAFRFDPTEDEYCLVKNLHIFSELGPLDYTINNGQVFNECILLSAGDPQIIVPISPEIQGEIDSITIEGEFQLDGAGSFIPTLLEQLSKTTQIAPESGRTKPLLLRPRTILKRIVGRPQYAKTEAGMQNRGNLKYNVDTFHYEDGMLTISGWCFVEEELTLTVSAVFMLQGKARQLMPVNHFIERLDCGAVFKCESSRTSGFNGHYRLHNIPVAKVYIRIKSENSDQLFYLGKIRTGQPAGQARIEMSGSKPPQGLHEFLNRVNTPVYPPNYFKKVVDVIVPVFNGFKHLDKFFSSFVKTNMPYRLILIDDASTDTRVLPFLKTISTNVPNSVLLSNSQNMGFAQSVNRCLEISEGDVVLLHTDVELPPNWLERLMYPIFTETTVATVTPFSHQGITEFPNYQFQKNDLSKELSTCSTKGAAELIEKLSLEAIDSIIHEMEPANTPLPIGSSFCMAISKKALDEVGDFDTSFGKGYGEDIDWCLRARAAGFIHALADNLYVSHECGGSYPQAIRTYQLQRNTALLKKRYPYFDDLLHIHQTQDVQKNLRGFLLMRCCNIQASRKPVAFFDAVECRSENPLYDKYYEALSENREVLQFILNESRITLLYRFHDIKIEFQFQDIADTLRLLSLINANEIFVGRIGRCKSLQFLLDGLSVYAKEHEVSLRYLLMDSSSLNTSSIDGENELALSASVWRNFLSNCNEIFAYSEYMATNFALSYPEAPSPIIKPILYNLPKINIPTINNKSLKIGIMNADDYASDSGIVNELIEAIEGLQANCEIVLLGKSDTIVDSKNILKIPDVEVGTLPKFILKHGINIIVDAAIYGRAISPIAQQSKEMGIPFACFAHGAQAEIAKTVTTSLIVEECSGKAMVQHILEWRDRVNIDQSPSYDKKVLFLTGVNDVTTRYRVEHVMEQLYFRGLFSDVVKLEDIHDLQDISWIDYSLVIVFRVFHSPFSAHVINHIKNCGIPVYYSLDDYMFDFERIKDSSTIKFSLDYVLIQNVSHAFQKAMEMCDAFIFSTEYLSTAAHKFFNKPVYTNRNVASIEMLAHSLRAKNCVVKNTERVTLGYYGSAATHSFDFRRIEDVIVRLLEEFPNLYLAFAGVFTENKKLDPFNDRITHYGSRDWRELPYLLATFDFAVMPILDEPYHLAISENKWTECSLLALPTVAQKTDELTSIIHHGTTGLLCDSEEDWYHSLSRFIQDREYRKEIGEKAQSYVLNNKLTLNANNCDMDFILNNFTQNE